jgi:hypothetical protein
MSYSLAINGETHGQKVFYDEIQRIRGFDACRIQYADDGERNREDQVEEEGKGEARNRFDEG